MDGEGKVVNKHTCELFKEESQDLPYKVCLENRYMLISHVV